MNTEKHRKATNSDSMLQIIGNFEPKKLSTLPIVDEFRSEELTPYMSHVVILSSEVPRVLDEARSIIRKL